jgi:hypothetical protein
LSWCAASGLIDQLAGDVLWGQRLLQSAYVVKHIGFSFCPYFNVLVGENQ